MSSWTGPERAARGPCTSRCITSSTRRQASQSSGSVLRLLVEIEIRVLIPCANCCISQIPYPIINLVTRLPVSFSGLSPISIRTRTFESYTLFFPQDSQCLDVFETVKDLTVARPCPFSRPTSFRSQPDPESSSLSVR